MEMNSMLNENYLKYREKFLNYTNTDMNLELENDSQIYIAVFDLPFDDKAAGGNTWTLALAFGLNTHLYFGDGSVLVDLEKNTEVMQAMQSLFISAPQVLDKMKLTDDVSFYESKNVRAYLKTRKGVYYSELTDKTSEERFLAMLINNVMDSITKSV
ncbi:MAG: hypothetical protein J6X97_04395 [Lachnospiraceae bacterium]|nr:hypothetical protein [Lachnospiraceae bacterium]